MLYTGDNPDMKTENTWAIDMTVFRYRGKLYAYGRDGKSLPA
jgi:hypothetical protein